MVPANLPLEVYIRREAFPDPDNLEANDRVATLLGPGIISISVRDVPALQAGTYFVLFHNPSGVELCFDVAIYGERNLSSKFTRTIEGGSASLADVARTVTSVQVDDARPVSDVQVGVRVEHARVSDLALRLVTPGGASALLFENRGLTTTNGLGGVLVTSNYQHVAMSLDRAGGVARIYFNGEVVAEQLVRLSASNSPTSFHLGALGSANLPGSPIQYTTSDSGVAPFEKRRSARFMSKEPSVVPRQPIWPVLDWRRSGPWTASVWILSPVRPLAAWAPPWRVR